MVKKMLQIIKVMKTYRSTMVNVEQNKYVYK